MSEKGKRAGARRRSRTAGPKATDETATQASDSGRGVRSRFSRLGARRRDPGTITRARKRGLIAFGLILAALFAGFVLFEGIGRPDVGSDVVAVIEDTPGGNTVISREEFDRSLEQVAAEGQVQQIPEEGTDEYKPLAEAALTQLIDIAWIQAEAIDRDISVTDFQVDAEFDQIVSQFGCDPEQDPADCEQFQKRLRQFKLTPEDLDAQVRTGLLGNEVLTSVTDDSAKPSDEQLNDYYDIFTDQFELPESRDVRLILNKDRAKVEDALTQLEADDSDASWQRVARELSTDASSRRNGGVRPALTDGLVEEPLNGAIFDTAEGEFGGPLETPLGFYVFQVEKITPARTQKFEDVRGQLRQQLAQQLTDVARQQFVADYGAKWASRTTCAEGFRFERCDNAGGEDDFASKSESDQLAQATEGAAPVLAGRTAWAKPPDALTLPIDPVSINGTQIVCYLVEPAEGQPTPLIGTAPAQRPHPPGDIEAALDQQVPGQAATPETCGPPSPVGLGGTLPGAGAPAP